MEYRPIRDPAGLSCSPRCAANREPGSCNCRRPWAGNSVYAAIRAMFPEARSCEDCVEAWFKQRGIVLESYRGYYWAPAEHSTLEES